MSAALRVEGHHLQSSGVTLLVGWTSISKADHSLVLEYRSARFQTLVYQGKTQEIRTFAQRRAILKIRYHGPMTYRR